MPVQIVVGPLLWKKRAPWSLPAEPQPELNVARRAGQTGDIAEVRCVAEPGIRIIEMMPVQHVQQLGAELQIRPLLESPILQQAHVLVRETGTAQHIVASQPVPEQVTLGVR